MFTDRIRETMFGDDTPDVHKFPGGYCGDDLPTLTFEIEGTVVEVKAYTLHYSRSGNILSADLSLTQPGMGTTNYTIKDDARLDEFVETLREYQETVDQLVDEATSTPDDTWPYCPNCGSELEEPAGPYQEWTDCPECGEVCIEFLRGDS